jgi:2-polyprenyl-6-methoxyphenol hydroxylase-like FAD-dependent oxidoreductase
VHVPVLIVGAGPVGLALAGDLGWRGIQCLIAEKTDGSIYQPKMDAVGIRTMEFCRRWGITSWVEQSPYPRDYPQDNVYVTSLRGYQLGREPMSSMADSVPPPQSPVHRERCPQNMFDPILRRFASSFSEVSLRYHYELIDFWQDDQRVTAVLSDENGTEAVVTADYLVGCDGASSLVRQKLGVTMGGRDLLTYTTNVVFRCDHLPDLHDKGLAYRFILIGPEGTWATLVAINGRDRWRFSLIGDGAPREWTRREIDASIRRAIGTDFDYEIETIVPWTRRELVADSYGSGRVYIAGDAAHMMSPTGGFGMNTGIGDAVDLAWKLEARLRNWGGPGLLEAYTVERRPVAVRVASESTQNLEAMLSPRQRRLTALLDPDAEGERTRLALGEHMIEVMKHEWFSLGLHLGLRYDDSPICVPDGTPAPPSPVTSYTQIARPGARAPHAWLGEGRSTLDLFGRRFVLLRLGESPPSGQAILAAASRKNVPMRVETISEERAAAAYERSLVLVRPDGFVAWRADKEPTDPDTVVDVVRGAHATAWKEQQ